MYTIQAYSVTDALCKGLRYLQDRGVKSDSRNGPVIVASVPITTMNIHPLNRVLFLPERGENPFFHLIEALWMLAGRRDLGPLTQIVKQIGAYSDDGGQTQPGAYGFRWRHWFKNVGDDADQLQWAIARLKKDPNDRRVVVSMWDARHDRRAADQGSSDVPCNTQFYLLVRDGRLDMTVTCRSNDMLWGAHGANAVHFSILLEYLAGHIGVKVGKLYQISNNYHLYEKMAGERLLGAARLWSVEDCFYHKNIVEPYPLFDADQSPAAWDEDLEMWWNNPAKTGLRHSFFRRVATPVLYSHKAYRNKHDRERFDTALEVISRCSAPDWKLACSHWLEKARSKERR